MKTQLLRLIALFFIGLLFTSPAFAAIDTSAVTTTISTDGTAAVTAVGAAITALAAVAMVFKWIKGAIFG